MENSLTTSPHNEPVSLIPQETPQVSRDALPENLLEEPLRGIPSHEVPHPNTVKNLYPAARHILLVTCILFSVCLIIFLMHQNGKNIYDNGI